MTAAPSNPSPNDRAASNAWLSALAMTAKLDIQPKHIFPRVVDDLGEKFGPAPALFSPPEDFSHAELAARARR